MQLAKMDFQRLVCDSYETWKLHARQAFSRGGLWQYVEDGLSDIEVRLAEWRTKNELALQTIGFLDEDARLRLIQDTVTAKDAWNIMWTYYIKNSSLGKVVLIKKLPKT